jgi:acetyl-CoA carboxylase carboxyl transferase subunit beta
MALYQRIRVCENCGHAFPMAARLHIRNLVDPDSFVESSLVQPTPRKFYTRPDYRAGRIRQAVITGAARIADHPAVIIAFDFRFFGGSMSVAAGEAVARAFEQATASQMPVVAVIASGGVRIQEGISALLQMAKTITTVQEFRDAHRPFIAILTSPTAGGVYASFGSLADILVAEPGAVIGFAGPRVAEALTHSKLPANSHRAEGALQNGMVDALVPREQIRAAIAQMLVLASPPTVSSGPPNTAREPEPVSKPRADAAGTLALARRTDRPDARAYIERLFTDFVELHGDRLLGDDPAILGGMARLKDQPVMVIAEMRRRGDPKERGSGPAGYHKSERLIRLAGRFGLPIVTFVDTPGADPSYESEKYGIAGAIANCLAAFLQAPVPTVSLLIGEGTSGGALALAAADAVLMQENAIYSVISPEGASVILYGDISHAGETVDMLGITADDLVSRGIIDRVIVEPEGGAHTNVDTAAEQVKRELQTCLADLQRQNAADRLAARRRRYRNNGSK